MSTILFDLRYALRSLARSRGTTAIALILLAFGIGANAAIFSAIRGILFRPVAFPEPERVVWLSVVAPEWRTSSFSAPEVAGLRESSPGLESVTPIDVDAVNLGGDGSDPARVLMLRGTADLFRVTGVEPLAGRPFAGAEEAASDVVLVTHELWQSRFASDRDLIGRTIVLDGTPRTVIGILPPHLELFSPDIALWAPLDLGARAAIPDAILNHNVSALGRIENGLSRAQAEAALSPRMQQILDAHPEHGNNESVRMELETVREELVQGTRRPLQILFGAALVVLLIACANVGSLQLVRFERRLRELSIRSALGAGRFRLAAQSLFESLLLALGGGAAGMVVAFWSIRLFRAAAPGTIPRVDRIGIDPAVMGFTVAAAVVAAILFGSVPALLLLKIHPRWVLREAGRGLTGGGATQWIRSSVVAGQFALAVVLVVAGGLLMRSLLNLSAVSTGFTTEQVVVASFTLPESTYASPKARLAFWNELHASVETSTAVRRATVSSYTPLRDMVSNWEFEIEGREDESGTLADYNQVAPDFFATLDIPIVQGRTFTEAEARSGLAAVVSESLAHRLWPNGDAVGRRINSNPGERVWREVVGVAGDIRSRSLRRAPSELVYYPMAELPFSGTAYGSLIVRMHGDPATAVGIIRDRVRALDPSLPISRVTTMRELRSRSLETTRFLVGLLSAFGLLALLLAAIGAYGLMAFFVEQRAREMGIRMALGADRGTVVRLVLRRGVALAAAGLAAGSVAALAAGRFLSALVFEITPDDPATIAGSCAILLLVAAVACLVPARRAGSTDPAVVLRAE